MNGRRVITLAMPPTGRVHHDVLRSVASLSTVVGLVVRSPKVQLTTRAQSLLAALSPFLVANEEVDRWPGTELVGGRKSRRLLFRLEPASLDLLIAATTGLFDWVNPQLPEDLHLLRSDGTTVLGTVAQEEDAWLELDEDELRQLRSSAPDDVTRLLSDDVR
jgi:hypothetical protein